MNFNDENNNNFNIDDFLNEFSLDEIAEMDYKQMVEPIPKPAKSDEQRRKELEEFEREEQLRIQKEKEDSERAAFELFYQQIKSICQNGEYNEMDLIKKYHKEAEYERYAKFHNEKQNTESRIESLPLTIIELPRIPVAELNTNKILGASKFYQKGEIGITGCKRCKQLFSLNRNLKNKVERVYGILREVKNKYYDLKLKLSRGKSSIKGNADRNKVDSAFQDELQALVANLTKKNEELLLELKKKEEIIRKREAKGVKHQGEIRKDYRFSFTRLNKNKKFREEMEELKIKHFEEEVELIKNQVTEQIEISTNEETDVEKTISVPSDQEKRITFINSVNNKNKYRREVSYSSMDPKFFAPNHMAKGVWCGNCQLECVSNSNIQDL